MRCDEVAQLLPEMAEGGSSDEAFDRHLASCLRCQAELARYRRLLRGLAALRSVTVEPPAGSLAGTLRALEDAAERKVVRSILSGRRLAVAAGAGTAVAAGAATAVVLIARGRRRGGSFPLAG